MHMIRSASENKILKWLCKYDSNFIVFHHRFPTSTVNVAKAAHPMSTYSYFGNKQYILVHNGIIRNADELFLDHQEKGIEYHSLLKDMTFNDSEALLWDLALTREGYQKEMQAYGDMAFILLEIEDNKLTKMHFGRNGRPLHMYRDKQTLELSSEGRGDDIKYNTWYTYNYLLNRLTKKECTFKSYDYSFKDYSKTWDSDDTHYSGKTYEDSDDFEDQMNNYNSHDEWLIAQEAKEARRQVTLALGVSHVTEREPVVIGEIVKDYPESKWVRNENGIWTEKPKKFLSYDDMTQDEIMALMPDIADIERTTMKYLQAAEGVYEVAYWAIEGEYSEIIEDSETEEDVKRILLLENVLQYIELDPDYKNEKSISPDWRSLCQQQLLA